MQLCAPVKHISINLTVPLSIIDRIKGGVEEYSPTEVVNDPLLEPFGVRLLIKRDDLIHSIAGGNKWRKLRHNLTDALQNDHHTLLTFGGAYSNHIAATVMAAKGAGLDSIGIIRGEDDPLNLTLQYARSMGMTLHFVSREEYRHRSEAQFIKNLAVRFGRFYMIPEGGANLNGLKGCVDILQEVKDDFDVVCCACGTGTTLAGLAMGLGRGQLAIGFPALKGGDFLLDEVIRLMAEANEDGIINRHSKIELSLDYHFGGYAKVTPELLNFIEGFTPRTGIPLDPVYTGKMMFGVYDLLKKGRFPKGSTVLVYHSGGSQGWEGMRQRGMAH